MRKIKVFTVTTSRNSYLDYEDYENNFAPIVKSETPWTEVSEEDYLIIYNWVRTRKETGTFLVEEHSQSSILKTIEQYKKQAIQELEKEKEQKIKRQLRLEEKKKKEKQLALENEKNTYEELKRKFENV